MVCDHHFHSSSSQQDFQQLVQQYKFTIEAIFDDQEARALFRTFLKKDLNEEPFIFYEAVEKYNKTRLDKNRFELASEIIDKFMVVGAQYELNLSTTLRNDILKSWKQIYEKNKDLVDSDLVSCPKDLFTRAQDIIFIELKQDNFPRFVNSETFKKHIQKEHKKDSSILDKLGKKKTSSFDRSSSDVSTVFDDNHSVASSSLVSTPSSESRQSMDDSSESDSFDEKIENHVTSLDTPELELKRSSSLSSVSSVSNMQSTYVTPKEGELIPLLDEMSPYVTPKDYQLALNLYDSFLNHTQEWNTLDDKVGMRTASSKPVYSFNPTKKTPSETRPRFVIGISGIVPGTTSEWINLMYTEKVKKKICNHFSQRFQVEYKSIDEQEGIQYPNSIIYMEAPLPFPMTNRDFLVAKTIIPDKYDPATGEYGRYIMIQKPSYHHEFPPNTKSTIRANHSIVYIVEKKGNASVRYTCLETGDMLGNIPSKITAQFYKSTAKVMHNKIRKVCSSAYESHVQKQTTVHDHDGGLATLTEYKDYYKM